MIRIRPVLAFQLCPSCKIIVDSSEGSCSLRPAARQVPFTLEVARIAPLKMNDVKTRFIDGAEDRLNSSMSPIIRQPLPGRGSSKKLRQARNEADQTLDHRGSLASVSPISDTRAGLRFRTSSSALGSDRLRNKTRLFLYSAINPVNPAAIPRQTSAGGCRRSGLREPASRTARLSFSLPTRGYHSPKPPPDRTESH